MEQSKPDSDLLINFKNKVEEGLQCVQQMTADDRVSALQLWKGITKTIQTLVKDAISAKEQKSEKENVATPSTSTAPSGSRRGRPAKKRDNLALKIESENLEKPVLSPNINRCCTQSDIREPTVEGADNHPVVNDNDEEVDDQDQESGLTPSGRQKRRHIKPQRYREDYVHPEDTSVSPSSDGLVYEGQLNVDESSSDSPEDDKDQDYADKKESKSLKCPACGYEACSRSALKVHVLTHNGNKPHQCNICGKAFATKSNCRRHEFKHKGTRPFKCPECGKNYTEKKNLALHMRTQHQSESKEYGTADLSIAQCKVCDAVLSGLSALTTHMYQHTGERPYSCEICGKAFTTKANCLRHEFKHKGEKPFQCPQCPKCYTENKSLKIHMRTHTGERPYKCDVCEKTFNQAGLLTMHKTVHTGVKSHLCSICGKAFRQKSQLFYHLRRHENLRKYTCDVCSKSFVAKGDLNRHKFRHTGERPYLCNLCPKTFNRLQYLKEHLNVHSGRKPYKCNLCSEGFPDLSSCARHQKKHKKEAENAAKQTLIAPPIIQEVTVSQNQTMEDETREFQVFQTGQVEEVYVTEPTAYLPAVAHNNGAHTSAIDGQPVTYMELVTVNFPGMSVMNGQVQQHQY